MYRRVLIANRSDCARELVHACHQENIETVVIAGRDDALDIGADYRVYTGQSRDAYVDQDNILEVARHYGCEALLPGWGFLSEDFQFARRCRMMHVDFVGPTSSQLQIFGDKLKTLQLLSACLEASHSFVSCQSPDFGRQVAMMSSGWMVKNRYGGGGKGIRLIQDYDELCCYVNELKNMNQAGMYYVEPAISEPRRHLEFQVIGDGCGKVVLLGARDCTPQVHHQKWLERSIDLNKRSDIRCIGERFCSILSGMNYLSWCTVECLVDSCGNVHLLEVNPRLQVEHLVTDISTHGSIIHDALTVSHHGELQDRCGYFDSVMEFRLYARSTGKLTVFEIPEYYDARSRVETAYHAGNMVSGIYDGMLARFVVESEDGKELYHLKRWLSSCRIEGVEHNLKDLYGMDYFPEMPSILI